VSEGPTSGLGTERHSDAGRPLRGVAIQDFDRALKIAIPITCLVIALFGAPLATSTQRGGTAYGIGVSLATTIIFLLMIQLTKAIGGKAIITPDVAAWLPNAMFAVVGLVLLVRVRT